MPARRIFGVDFSGAADAGKKIWLAEGYPSAAGLVVENCRAAVDRLGCGSAPDTCLPALVEFIGDQRDAVFGCDFPFGLPEDLIAEASWEDFLRDFPLRFASAEAFRECCRAATDGKELKRETDGPGNAETPFSAYNIRLYRQTYFGIACVLWPLVMEGRATVLPFQRAASRLPWVLETCPASTLKHMDRTLRLGWDLHRHYKGGTPEHRKNRRRILSVLIDSHCLAPLRDDIRSKVLKNVGGDALDSIVAAVAAHRAAVDGLGPPVNRTEALEGKVYFRVCSETKGAHAR